MYRIGVCCRKYIWINTIVVLDGTSFMQNIGNICLETPTRIWVRSRCLKLFVCNVVNGEGGEKLHGSFQLEYGEEVVMVVMETYTPPWRDVNSERRPRGYVRFPKFSFSAVRRADVYNRPIDGRPPVFLFH